MYQTLIQQYNRQLHLKLHNKKKGWEYRNEEEILANNVHNWVDEEK